jgi:hypothetical protein
LYSLPHEIQWKDGSFGNDAAYHARSGIFATPGHIEARQLHPQPLIRDKEYAHKRHNLAQRGTDAPKKASVSFVPLDVRYGTPQGTVYLATTLRSEPRPQQVKRIRNRRGERPGGCARYEALGRIWQPRRQRRL